MQARIADLGKFDACRFSDGHRAKRDPVRPQDKRPVILRSLNGAPPVLWAARKPSQAVNVRLLPIRHPSWQALYEVSIRIVALVHDVSRSPGIVTPDGQCRHDGMKGSTA
jgi:hypothetical protein